MTNYDVWEELQRFTRKIGVHIGDFVNDPMTSTPFDGRLFEIINRHNHRLLKHMEIRRIFWQFRKDLRIGFL